MTAPAAATGAAGVPQLNVQVVNPGHWHVNKSKTLTLRISDVSGVPIKGLEPSLTVKTLKGRSDKLSLADNGDGTYSSAPYTAWDLGGTYSTGYALVAEAHYLGTGYYEAWPVEVVRDGNERILPEKDGNKFAYQVRFGLDNGMPVADDEKPVTIYFDPRRAVQEGDKINTAQPFRNTFNPLGDLKPTVIVESTDGQIKEEITPTYSGMGVYRVARVFSKAEVGKSREYKVSFVFTDPYNGVVIGKEHSSYPVTVVVEAAHTEVAESGGAMPAGIPGEMVFKNSCGMCHALPTAEKIKSFASDDEMKKVVENMAKMAMMSAHDTEEVMEYMMAVRKGSGH